MPVRHQCAYAGRISLKMIVRSHTFGNLVAQQSPNSRQFGGLLVEIEQSGSRRGMSKSPTIRSKHTNTLGTGDQIT